MIASPHNDRECLDAITARVAALVRDRDPALDAPSVDPNCLERAVMYLGSADLIDPVRVRRLPTPTVATSSSRRRSKGA